jgi:hypothetical protein
MSDDIAEAQDFLERYVAETIQIGRQGESRARYLEWAGTLAVVLAFLNAAAGIVIVVAVDNEDIADSAIILWTAVSTGWALLVAAVFFGFSSLVRNSSRSLSIQALTSSLDEDED